MEPTRNEIEGTRGTDYLEAGKDDNGGGGVWKELQVLETEVATEGALSELVDGPVPQWVTNQTKNFVSKLM